MAYKLSHDARQEFQDFDQYLQDFIALALFSFDGFF